MTRATPKPVVRVVDGGNVGELVVEIRDSGVLLRRPRSRKSSAVGLSWNSVYYIASERAAQECRPPGRRRRRRVTA